MNNREFKRLRAKKDAQTIKEEYMMGKHGKLTDKQLETICNYGLGHGGISFGRSMTPEEMEKRHDELTKKSNKRSIHMPNINKKIVELYKKGKELQDAALNSSFEQSIKIRQVQKETFDRFHFFKGFKTATDKEKLKDKETNKNDKHKSNTN